MPERKSPETTFAEGEAQRVINFKAATRYLEEPIQDHEIQNFVHKRDASLEKYLVFIRGKGKNYYLSKNTNYEMRVVYENMQALHDALPEHFPEPVAYVEESDSLLAEAVEGDNFLEQFSHLSETEQLEVFRKTGELLRKLHAVPAERLNLKANQYTGTLEGIMSSINKENFDVIEQEDPPFAKKLRGLYEIITQHESRLQKESSLSVVYGDLHPGNILVSRDGRPILTDVDDVTVALKERDIGTFLEQSDSILRKQRDLASERDIQKYQRAFLTGYHGEETDTVKFYRAWIAWRNAMYFRSRVNPDINMANISLDSSEHHLKTIGLV